MRIFHSIFISCRTNRSDLFLLRFPLLNTAPRSIARHFLIAYYYPNLSARLGVLKRGLDVSSQVLTIARFLVAWMRLSTDSGCRKSLNGREKCFDKSRRDKVSHASCLMDWRIKSFCGLPYFSNCIASNFSISVLLLHISPISSDLKLVIILSWNSFVNPKQNISEMRELLFAITCFEF